jgi:ATP-dependent DNA helicase RecQ
MRTLPFRRSIVRARLALRRFGFPAFLPYQLPVILALLRNRNVLAVLGTGSGKSLCWWIPALLRRGVTVVVTPHIALMEDQVARFNRLMPGSRAAYLNSNLTRPQVNALLAALDDHSIRLLYLAPEALHRVRLRDVLREVGVRLLVLDEAHCLVSDSSYRPAYWMVGLYAREIGARQVACFSATIPKGFVESTIIALLELDDPAVFRGPLNRRNHYYEVLSFADNWARNLGLKQLLLQLRDLGADRGIVYCARKKDVPVVLDFLRAWGFSATSYVGGLTLRRDRLQNQANMQLYLDGACQVLVATRAFELGIDAPDTRFVVAYNLPQSISSLHQMFGRAGRDGRPAYCIVLATPQDHALQQVFRQKNLLSLRDSRAKLPPALRRKIHLRLWKQYLREQRDQVRLLLRNTGACTRGIILHALNRRLSRQPTVCCGNCERSNQPRST